MAKDYTAQKLVETLKRRVSMPTSQNLYSTEDLILFMSEELQGTMVPAITSVREEYFVQIVDVPVDTTTNEYRIPTRASGGSLRDFSLLDTSGNEIFLPRLNLEQIKNSRSRTSIRLFGFYLQNDKVVLFPEKLVGIAGYTVRFRIERLPGDLTLTSAASTITAINTALKQVTVSAASSAWTAATKFDFIDNKPIFTSLGDDLAISNITTNVLTFVDTLPADLSIGNWVAETGFSPVPQIPYIGFQWLAQLGGVKALEALTDQKGMENAYAASTRLEKQFIKSLTPRVKGVPVKVVSQGGIHDWISGNGLNRRGNW